MQVTQWCWLIIVNDAGERPNESDSYSWQYHYTGKYFDVAYPEDQ